MASAGKKKFKKKTLSLNEFLSDDAGKPAPFVPATSSWADEMENADADDDGGDNYGIPSKQVVNRAVLPTAPRAARGPDVDMAKIPTKPPFTAFLGNLSYDANEEEIEKFFRGLKLVNVRLPQDGGRFKGFGYAEFEDQQTLIDALAMNESMMKGRKVRIDLAEQSGDGRDGRDGDRRGGHRDRDDGGEDRTLGDWRRSDDRPAFEPRRDDRRDGGDRYGDRGGDRDRGGAWGHDRDRDRGFGGGGGGRYGDRDSHDDRDGYGSKRSFGSGYRDGGDRFGDRDRDRGERYLPPGRDERDNRFGPPRDRENRYEPPRDRDDRYGGGPPRDRDDKYGGGPPRDRDDRYGSGPPREDRYGGGPPRGRDDRYGPPRDGDQGPHERDDRDGPKERPRLKLQPRTKPKKKKVPTATLR